MKILMRPVEVLVLASLDGTLTPLRFRIDSKDDGSPIEIRIEQVLSQSENHWAGNPMFLYECIGQINDKPRHFDLKYEVKTRKWFLYRI